jgi:predicted Fe-Mo cluster-binding NifX family protein
VNSRYTNKIEEEHDMKICFPVQKDNGVESTVYNHFGSASVFVVFDTDTNSIVSINNSDQHHTHGACNPMKALDNQKVDAIVVGGIGAGALTRLNQMGITVHRSQGETIRENLSMFQAKSLPILTVQGCCGGHSNDGGCAH